MSQNNKSIFDVTNPNNEISDEELLLLLDCGYKEEDWDRDTGPCESHYQLRNLFVSEESAKLQINRILTALREIRNGSLDK